MGREIGPILATAQIRRFGPKWPLKTSLEEQRAATTSIEQEFSAYRRQHALGSELGALQDAVAGLQEQLTERNKKKKG